MASVERGQYLTRHVKTRDGYGIRLPKAQSDFRLWASRGDVEFAFGADDNGVELRGAAFRDRHSKTEFGSGFAERGGAGVNSSKRRSWQPVGASSDGCVVSALH